MGPPYYYVPDERDYRKRGPGDHFGYKRHTVGPYGTHSFRYEHVLSVTTVWCVNRILKAVAVIYSFVMVAPVS